MNSVQVKVTSTFLAVILISGGGLAPVVSLAANLPVADTSSIPANHALLMRAAGQVMKADMIDESRELLGEPQPAKVNDLLPEGSVLGTGRASWAEIKWTSVVSRIWQDTVIQIRPSKRSVFLQEGSLRFQLKKDRPDKAPYDIRTKVLQARVHGTTVYVDCRKDVEKISVLEGNIDVVNLQNKSVVHLTPGVVYEVKVLGTIKTPTPFVLTAPRQKSDAAGENKTPIAEIPDIRLDPKKGEIIFQDKNTRTIAYTANSKAILDDPMIGGENPIASYGLIQDAIAKVPGFSLPDAITMISSKPDRNLVKNFKIVAVPSTTAYMIGRNVGASGGFALPQVAYTDLHPAGTVDARMETANVASIKPVIMTAPMRPGIMQNAPGDEFKTTLLPEPDVKIGEGTNTPLDRSINLGAIGSAAFTATRSTFQPTAVFNTAGVAPQMPVFTNPVSNLNPGASQTAFTPAGGSFTVVPAVPSVTPFAAPFSSSPASPAVLSERRTDLVNVNINISGGRTN